jgi:uncharacterized membrane protein
MAQGLGLFSIGLGLSELLAPEKVANLIGVRRSNTWLIRLFGIREIASGVAIFVQGRRPKQAVWSRVAGDAVDLAALGAAFGSRRTNRAKLAFATANVIAVTALDVKCAKQLSDFRNGASWGSDRSNAVKSLIIDRAPEELYQAWRQFQNLPQFLKHLESVTPNGDRSHWVAQGPAGTKVEWDAEVVDDRPNEHIAWRSLPGGDIQHSGFVCFERAPGNRGTIVKVKLDYKLPGGRFGTAFAKLLGKDPSQRAMEALRHFKQVMETGEMVVSEGTLSGTSFMEQRPARATGPEDEKDQASNSRRRERRAIQPMEGNYAS